MEAAAAAAGRNDVPPPPPMVVVPSSAAVAQQAAARNQSQGGAEEAMREAGEPEEAPGREEGEAPVASFVQAAISTIDNQLDKVEAAPPTASKALFTVADGPLGREASRVVQKTAKGLAEVGGEALGEAVRIGAPVARKGAGVVLKAAFDAATSSGSKAKAKPRPKQ